MSVRSAQNMLAARAAAGVRMASEQDARRQRVRTHQVRESRRQTVGVAVAATFLAGALAAGVYFGVTMPTKELVTAEKTKPDTFAQTRTGHIYIPIDGGSFCRSLKFNNQTGETSAAGLVGCEDLVAATGSPSPKGSTYTTFTESFKNR
jgi:hypothetical protein